MKAAQDRLDVIADRVKKQADAKALIVKGRARTDHATLRPGDLRRSRRAELAPDDRDAQQGLAEATKTRDAVRAEFNQKMMLGQNALTAQRFADARPSSWHAAQIFPDGQESCAGIGWPRKVSMPSPRRFPRSFRSPAHSGDRTADLSRSGPNRHAGAPLLRRRHRVHRDACKSRRTIRPPWPV